MYRDRIKVFLLLFVSFTFMFTYASASGEINFNDMFMRLNKRSTSHKYESSFFGGIYKMYNEMYEQTSSFSTDHNVRPYKRESVVSKMIQRNTDSFRNNAKQHWKNPLFLSSPFDTLQKQKMLTVELLDKRLEKRNAVQENVNSRKTIPKGKQKKAKALGRLLMNNPSIKNDEDIQDDYIEDEDDDYSKGLGKKKMNWEEFQNEDGASVMELVALNTRHKTNFQQGNEYE